MNLRLAVCFAFMVFGGAVLWTSTLNEQATFLQFATPRFLQGLGIAFFFLPLNAIMLSEIRGDELANATGLSNFCRTMAGSIATAVTIWMWNRRTDYHHAVWTEHVRDSSSGWLHYQSQLDAIGIKGIHAFQFVDRIITQQASTLGVNDVFVAFACLYFAILPFIWFARPPFTFKRGTPGH